MDYVSAIGPGSDLLDRSEINGRTLVSRNGEVTQNAFPDTTVWNKVVRRAEHRNKPYNVAAPFGVEAGLAPQGSIVPGIQDEFLPNFHEWVTTQVGFVCVFDKSSANSYRTHIQAEMAVPVISCAQMLCSLDDHMFEFAGIARSPSVRDYDDVQNGAKFDEYFTLAIGGMCTILNNSNNIINRGDLVEWTFLDQSSMPSMSKKPKAGPRRIQVRKATDSHKRVFGKAMSPARRGEQFDVLLKQ